MCQDSVPGSRAHVMHRLERVQKCCLKIIYPTLSYSEALEESGLDRLDTRREEITQSTFRQVKCPTHPLHYMLPPPQGFHFSNDIKTDLPLFSSKV